MIELMIRHGNKMYEPIIEGEVNLSSERKGSPAKLEFNVVKDSVINFAEGDHVTFKADGQNMFYGFVFTKKRSKNGIIKVTAYDQLRYLKNKDTYVYSNKTASEFLQMIIKDFNLQAGEIDDTGFKIPTRVEDDQTLFDMIYNALDLTLDNKKKLYVLYDDFGKICLKDINNMKLNLLLCDETAQDFDYESSIDGQTYNKIKLSRENEETGKRDVYISQSSESINNWGVLQYYEKLNDNSKLDPKAKADALLGLYNMVARKLTVNGCFGDTRVRAGSSILVDLDLGDTIVKNYMVVQTCKHKFGHRTHFMDLTLIGGAFIE